MKNYGPRQMAKDFNRIAESSEMSIQNTEKTVRKLNYYNKLFEEGYKIGIKNGSIDDKTELVEENGKMIAKKDHRNFKAGYSKGLKDFKNNLELLNNLQKNVDNQPIHKHK